ncbi:MAG: tRNA pseudouridine(38-40) synthase TruA [Actinomycetota bacterium]
MNEPVDELVDGFTRLRLDFGYDGTDFFGWSKQTDLRTIQGEFLKALTLIFGEVENGFGLRVAGRTDAGVHAVGQVLHMDILDSQLKRLGRNNSMADIAYKLNGLLPLDIRINKVSVAPEGFDARFSAINRRYRYRLADQTATKNPLESRFTLETFGNLDTDAMNEAGRVLLGLHDFASFCKPREGSTTIRELQEIVVNRVANGVVEIEVQADAFCHNMVRSIVGALIGVGQGKADAAKIKELLEKTNREGSFKVVSPHGLQLMAIGYPADDLLAVQAKEARNLRTLEDN